MSNSGITAQAVSKLCHDLVNPLGALGNGIELLELTGQAGGEEMALIKQALSDATARLGFYRIAFGAASDQIIPRHEIIGIFDALNLHARVTFHWQSAEDPTRSHAKRALLGLLCAQTALPMGGRATHDGQTVSAEGSEVAMDPALWGPLTEGRAPENLASGDIHFALLAQTMAEQGRALAIQHTPGTLTVGL